MTAPSTGEIDDWLNGPNDKATNRAWMSRLLGDDEALASSSTREVIFFGQDDVKGQVAPFLDRVEAFPNTLILGESGIGKTQFGRWIASQRSEAFEEMLCPAKPEDIPIRGIVLLDEAHRQRSPEWLFPTMESDTVTILAATTRPELLEPAFKTRFFITIHMPKADEKALIELCQHLLPDVDDESASIYAGASAGNPRQMERICAVAKEVGVNDPDLALAISRLTVDGVSEYQIRVLETLRRAARPMGIGSIAVMMYSDEASVREAERLLVENGLVGLHSNGRTLTKRGKRYLEKVNAT